MGAPPRRATAGTRAWRARRRRRSRRDEEDEEDAAGIGDAVEELGHGNLREGLDRTRRACGARVPRRVGPGAGPGPPGRWTGVRRRGTSAARNGATFRPWLHGRRASRHRSRRRFGGADAPRALRGGRRRCQRPDARRQPLVGGPVEPRPGGRPAVAAHATRSRRSSGVWVPIALHAMFTGHGRRGPLPRLAGLGQPVRAGRLRLPAPADRRAAAVAVAFLAVHDWNDPRAWRAGAEAAWSAAWWDLVLFVAAAGRRPRRRGPPRPRAGHREGAGRGAGAGRGRRGAGPDRPRAARRRHPSPEPRRPPGDGRLRDARPRSRAGAGAPAGHRAQRPGGPDRDAPAARRAPRRGRRTPADAPARGGGRRRPHRLRARPPGSPSGWPSRARRAGCPRASGSRCTGSCRSR